MITVFTSCHNQGIYLAEAIESVLAQSHGDFEYFLFDDGSTDSTWDIIRYYAAADSRIISIRVKKEPNVAYLINESIRRMQGKFWTWCPSDDLWHEDLLRDKLTLSISLAHNAIIYSDWEVVDSNLNHLTYVKPRLSPEQVARDVWKRAPIGFTGIWIPRRIFDTVGLFPLHLQYSEDYYWMIKSIIHGVQYYGVQRSLYKKRVHGGQNTERNRKKILEQMPKIWKELGEYQRNIS